MAVDLLARGSSHRCDRTTDAAADLRQPGAGVLVERRGEAVRRPASAGFGRSLRDRKGRQVFLEAASPHHGRLEDPPGHIAGVGELRAERCLQIHPSADPHGARVRHGEGPASDHPAILCRRYVGMVGWTLRRPLRLACPVHHRAPGFAHDLLRYPLLAL